VTLKRKLAWIARGSVVALLASCAFIPDDAHLVAEKERKTAPDFSLKDSTGATVKLSDYRGQVVLVNFWATWCGPCQEEIPWFVSFQRDYKDRKFTVLGLSCDDDGWNVVKPYVDAHKINYPVMLAGDREQTLYGNVQALPTSFILDQQGRVASHHVGLVSKKTYREEILGLLETPTHVTGQYSGSAPVSGLLAFLRTK
jgi:peroxiredoxin